MAMDSDRIDSGCGVRGAVCIEAAATQSGKQRGGQIERMVMDDELRSDVDLNGRVDILDAFAMARQLRDGSGEARDFNHDGRFDKLDIDLVAREAVKL